MARPIETADEELLVAADRVLMTEGPAGFTLAKAGQRAGVSAATLVKRFGSKEALFLRLSQRWVASLEGDLSISAAGHASALARLRAAALHNYHDLDNPDTASKQLAALAVDLQNDEMRALLHVGWGHVRTHLRRHAADAVAAGELVGCPTGQRLGAQPDRRATDAPDGHRHPPGWNSDRTNMRPPLDHDRTVCVRSGRDRGRTAYVEVQGAVPATLGRSTPGPGQDWLTAGASHPARRRA